VLSVNFFYFIKKKDKILTTLNNDSVDIEFPLKPGWALKENQKMGNKGGGKRISKKVIQYLQAYFHAGNLNPKD